MKSNFQNVNRRFWALMMSALMVLTTVAGSLTLPAKEAEAASTSILVDGNFANLQSSDAETGWWIYDAQNDGNWANCAANITAEGEGLVIDYTANNGGFYDAIWGIQIPQMMTVEAGVPYTFSFDVESTGTKSIKAKVDGKEAVLDQDFTAAAGTQTFTVENVTFDADGAVKFLFALGWMAGDDAQVEVKISNVKMEAPAAEPETLDTFILDGNFAGEMSDAEPESGWWYYNDWGGSWSGVNATTSNDGTGLTVDFANTGWSEWGLQIFQMVTLNAGSDYVLSFDVESTGNKSIHAKFDAAEAVLDTTFNAVAGTQTFTVDIAGPEADTTYKYLFDLGSHGNDDPSVTIKISNVTILPKAAPAQSLIIDGDFAAGMPEEEPAEGWWMYNDWGGSWSGVNAAVSTSPAGEGLAVDFINTGWSEWGLQIFQMVTAAANTDYVLSFDVESTGNKSIHVKYDAAESVLDTTVNAVAGTQTFTIDVPAVDAETTFKFLFDLGSHGNDDPSVNIIISNVSLTPAEAAPQPPTPPVPGVVDPIEAPEKTVEEMAAAGYTLVWSDEFDGDSLDLSKWDYQIGNGQVASNNPGWGNNEAEYYTNSTDNVYVQDGNLHITALKQDTTDPREGTFHYTSGRIRTTSDVTGQLFATKYGRVEARMILPTEVGAWPAFWMLPQDQSIYRGWAASGEIDIMEAYGDKPYLFGGTIHYGSQWPNNVYKGQSYRFGNTTDVSVYHTYGINWEPGKITWFVDDEEYYTADTWYSITGGNAANTTFDAPFDVPFYILLNVAVNGNWDAGEADDGDYTGAGKSSMLVDYVRVYAKDGVDYDTTTPAIAGGAGSDADAYAAYVYPLCGDDYEGFNFIQDDAFSTLKNVDVVEPTDTDWQFYVGDFGGVASYTLEDGVVTVDIASAGNQTYAIQLIKHMPMLKGYNYKVTFDAYADADRDITIHPSGDADNGWAGYAAYTPTITTTPATYSYSFTMGNDTDPTARLEFNLGAAGNANVHISNVKFEMIEQIEIDDAVVKTPLADGNLIWNGTFDQGPKRLAYWTVTGSAEVPNYVIGRIAGRDKVVLNDRNGLEENYTRRAILGAGTEIAQLGLSLTQSDQYKITFKAYAADEQILMVGVAGNEGAYVIDSITTTPGVEGSYEVIFAMPRDVNDAEAMLAFYNFSDGEIQLDDVAMYPLTQNNAEAADYSGVVVNPVTPDSDSFYVNYYTAANDPAVAEDGVFTIQTWHDSNNYQSMFLHPVDLTKDINYVLTFDAKSDVANTYEVAVQEDNTWAMAMGNQFFDTTSEWQTYTMNFTSGLTTGGNTTYLKYLLTSCENTTNLYLKNVSLTAIIPEAEGGAIDAPEGTAVLTTSVIKDGDTAVIELAAGEWADRFAEFVANPAASTHTAVIMVDSFALDYCDFPAIVDGNIITIPEEYLLQGVTRIELALDGYNNIVLGISVEPSDEPEEPEEPTEPTEPSNPDDGGNPGLNPDDGGETGDFHAMWYLLMMGIAACGAFAAIADKKRRA